MVKINLIMKNSDLHTHSYYSDGQLSPRELVRLAKERGIKNLALTDHNSVKGLQEAINEGKKIGIDVIPGVEISTDDGEVLGYFIDLKNMVLLKKLRENSKAIENKIKNWCKKLRKAGYDITLKEIERQFPKAKGNFNEFHVLYMLYLKGYGNPIKLSEKFKKNKRLKAKKVKLMTMPQAIKLIKKAGGVPVLAHPWLDGTEKNFKRMQNLVKAGLKGIEINNGDRAPFKKKGINKEIRKIAKKYNLILTSGSDYHGEEIIKFMPGNHNLGKNNCSEDVVKEMRKVCESD
jgi:hypothetical protein